MGAAARYWPVPLLRAVPALGVGLVITFTQEHSATVGLIGFGILALVSGLIIAVMSARTLTGPLRTTLLAQGIVSTVFGAASLAMATSGIALLLFTVSVYAALTGALELYAGFRARGSLLARDWVTVGSITAVLAVVFALIPPDSLLATGLVGAYALIIGVYLTIAGLSLRWSGNDTAVTDSLRKEQHHDG